MNVRDWILGVLLTLSAFLLREGYYDIKSELVALQEEGRERGDMIYSAKEIGKANGFNIANNMLRHEYTSDEYLAVKDPDNNKIKLMRN